MIATLILLVPLAVPAAVGPFSPMAAAPIHARVDEFDDRYEAAVDDVDALWELYEWCLEENAPKRDSTKACKRIIKLEPDHKRAREALGHVKYGDEWFDSEKKLEAHKKKEEERLAKERGWVKWKGTWVPPGDVPMLEKGLVKSEDGEWMSPEDLEKLEAGWLRQDLVWVAPDEAGNLEKGLWKCGDDWLSLERADAYHEEPKSWWVIPSGHFVLHTTLPREKALVAIDHMEAAFRDLVALLGVLPSQQVHVAMFRSLQQYNDFAANGMYGEGDPFGFSGTFGAYPALNWIEPSPRRFHGGGVGYWDVKDPNGDAFGPYHARFAAGYSYVEAIDGSRAVVDKWEAGKSGSFDLDGYFKGRLLPEWLRFGVVACAGRYWTETRPGFDKESVRRWSISNIAGKGGLDDVKDIVAFAADTNSQTGQTAAGKLINQAGLLLAFTIYGKEGDLRHAHAAFKEALKGGQKRDIDKAAKAYAKALEKLEKELGAYVQI